MAPLRLGSERNSFYSYRQCPPQFRCPMCGDIFRDPVILSSGETFDRACIKSHLAVGHMTCPQTGDPLHSFALTSNFVLRQLVQNWCTRQLIPWPAPSDVPPRNLEEGLYLLWRVYSSKQAKTCRPQLLLLNVHGMGCVSGWLVNCRLDPDPGNAVPLRGAWQLHYVKETVVRLCLEQGEGLLDPDAIDRTRYTWDFHAGKLSNQHLDAIPAASHPTVQPMQQSPSPHVPVVPNPTYGSSAPLAPSGAVGTMESAGSSSILARTSNGITRPTSQSSNLASGEDDDAMSPAELREQGSATHCFSEPELNSELSNPPSSISSDPSINGELSSNSTASLTAPSPPPSLPTGHLREQSSITRHRPLVSGGSLTQIAQHMSPPSQALSTYDEEDLARVFPTPPAPADCAAHAAHAPASLFVEEHFLPSSLPRQADAPGYSGPLRPGQYDVGGAWLETTGDVEYMGGELTLWPGGAVTGVLRPRVSTVVYVVMGEWEAKDSRVSFFTFIHDPEDLTLAAEQVYRLDAHYRDGVLAGCGLHWLYLPRGRPLALPQQVYDRDVVAIHSGIFRLGVERALVASPPPPVLPCGVAALPLVGWLVELVSEGLDAARGVSVLLQLQAGGKLGGVMAVGRINKAVEGEWQRSGTLQWRVGGKGYLCLFKCVLQGRLVMGSVQVVQGSVITTTGHVALERAD